MSWVAKYDGTCPSCHGRIRADVDVIDWDHTEVVHVQCPDPLEIPATGICPSCHLTLPATGTCGNC